jgi:hypothetical protein
MTPTAFALPRSAYPFRHKAERCRSGATPSRPKSEHLGPLDEAKPVDVLPSLTFGAGMTCPLQ